MYIKSLSKTCNKISFFVGVGSIIRCHSSLLPNTIQEMGLLVRLGTEMKLIWDTETLLCRILAVITSMDLKLTQEKKSEKCKVSKGDTELEIKGHIKYFRVTLDRNIWMMKHIKTTVT